jgi:hypothetical protein
VSQPPLRDDAGATGRRADGSLTVRAQPNQPLTKAQKSFNRLVARIEQLRARLEADTQRLDEALVYHAQHLRHRIEAVVSVRKEVVRALAPFLDDRRLKKGDTKVLETVLIHQLDGVLAHADTVEDDLRALFEQLHRVGITDVAEEQLKESREELEAMFAQMGISVDLSNVRLGMTEQDMATEAAGLVDELQREATEAGERTRGERRKTKREQRDEERRLKSDEARKISLGSIYRQLAKVLHPDLEPDADRRHAKSALMQELTAAYASQDLHTLLRLQLEWIQREQSGAAQMADDRLDAYNLVLKEQVAELELDLAALPLNPKYGPLIQDSGPFGAVVRTDGAAEARRLDGVLESLTGALESLRAPHALKNVRLLIREQRAADREALRWP